MTVTTGRCLCGGVRYECTGEPLWAAHCHCESCRRFHSAPFISAFGVARERVRFTGEPVRVYESSPGVRRSFCPRCGSPMSYERDTDPDEIALFAATLDKPERFQPQEHVLADEQLPWVHLADGLPRDSGDQDG